MGPRHLRLTAAYEVHRSACPDRQKLAPDPSSRIDLEAALGIGVCQSARQDGDSQDEEIVSSHAPHFGRWVSGHSNKTEAAEVKWRFGPCDFEGH